MIRYADICPASSFNRALPTPPPYYKNSDDRVVRRKKTLRKCLSEHVKKGEHIAYDIYVNDIPHPYYVISDRYLNPYLVYWHIDDE